MYPLSLFLFLNNFLLKYILTGHVYYYLFNTHSSAFPSFLKMWKDWIQHSGFGLSMSNKKLINICLFKGDFRVKSLFVATSYSHGFFSMMQ